VRALGAVEEVEGLGFLGGGCCCDLVGTGVLVWVRDA
jgi:hypothetical protein